MYIVVGVYSILSAIRRMDTFSYPSRTNNSLAASRISCRKNFFCLALRSFTPISQPVHLLNAVHYLLIMDCLSIATSVWKSLLTSYPPGGMEVCEPEEAERDGRPALPPAGRRAGSRLPAPWPLPLVTSIWCVR